MIQPQELPTTRLNGRLFIQLAVFAVIAIAGYYVAKAFDVNLVRWRYKIMPERQPDMLLQTLSSFRAVGQLLTIPLIIVVVVAYDHRWKKIVTALLISEILAFGGFSTVKRVWPRYRPHVMVEHVAPLDKLSWDGSWAKAPKEEVAKEKDYMRSFGSGHSA